MRLINASRTAFRIEEIPILTDKNQAFYEGCRYMQKRVLRILHTSKTIDAVLVVRCKDCKHFSRPTNWPTEYTKGRCDVEIWERRVHPDNFCAYGERKDGE